MRIGIDIDGVIAKNSIENWMSKIRSVYPEFSVISPTSYSIEVLSGLSTQEAIEMFNQSVIENPPLVYENCVNIINNLISMGHEIYIITSRDICLHDETKRWLKANKISNKCHLVFCSFPIKKADFAKEYGFSVVIDDNILEYVNSQNEKYSIIIMSQTYNNTYNLSGKMIIVDNWNDIEEEIANIIFMKDELRIK